MPSHPSSAEPVLLSLKEAASLGYGAYSTLRLHVANGDLPAERFGRRVKVRRADLDALSQPTTTPSNESLDAAIERLIKHAPRLSDDQRRRVASLLGGA